MSKKLWKCKVFSIKINDDFTKELEQFQIDNNIEIMSINITSEDFIGSIGDGDLELNCLEATAYVMYVDIKQEDK